MTQAVRNAAIAHVRIIVTILGSPGTKDNLARPPGRNGDELSSLSKSVQLDSIAGTVNVTERTGC